MFRTFRLVRGPAPLLLIGLGACGHPSVAPSQGPLFVTGGAEELELAVTLSLEHMAARTPQASQLQPTRVVVDELGMAHCRLQQRVDGVPVFGGEAIVHLHDDGRLASIGDRLVPGLELDTTPLLDAEDAVELALIETLSWAELSADPTADLQVLRHRRADHLVWRVQLERLFDTDEPTRPVVFIDAHSGEAVWTYENLHTGTGTTNYYGGVTIGTYQVDSDHYLEDTSRNIGTYSANFGTSALYYITDPDDAFEESWQANGVEGHWAAAAVYDYYLDTFGRDGIDGAGGPGFVSSLTGSGTTISVIVDYGYSYANAFWAGDYMAIGGGDGSTFGSLSTLDIVGHEMTHGVVEQTAALIYANESGALDESIADIFGAMVERHTLGESDATWTVGEDCLTPGTPGDAVRYMYDPTLDGYARDHYDDLYTGPADSGGVHDNAGIGYLAFYLAAQGGTHPTYPSRSFYGIGADDAAAIWYRALTTYMSSSTDFAGAREATLSAATDLHGEGSVEYNIVALAWAEVGVGCHVGAPGAFNYCATDCTCAEGEGACDSDAECDSGLVCMESSGAAYGLDWWIDVCVPEATSCHPSAAGSWNYCSASCTCAEGEGECDSDAECDAGLACQDNVGTLYGQSWWLDLCMPEGASCHPGSLGDWNYCSASCTCGEGEGQCDSDAECDPGMVCAENVGSLYGQSWWLDLCMPEGASCHPGTQGDWNYCSATCTCAEGEGECDSDAECDAGLVCQDNVGSLYGQDWWLDLCMPEGASCHPGTLGAWNYCNGTCTCAEGEGQCDSDAECDGGLTCAQNSGASYGLDWWVDVCVP